MFLTKIDRLAHGSLPAAQQSDPEAFARAEGSSLRKHNFRHEVLAAVLRGCVRTHVTDYYFDENRPCFRSGGQRGGSSEMSCETRLAVRSLVFFHSLPACNIDE